MFESFHLVGTDGSLVATVQIKFAWSAAWSADPLEVINHLGKAYVATGIRETRQGIEAPVFRRAAASNAEHEIRRVGGAIRWPDFKIDHIAIDFGSMKPRPIRPVS